MEIFEQKEELKNNKENLENSLHSKIEDLKKKEKNREEIEKELLLYFSNTKELGELEKMIDELKTLKDRKNILSIMRLSKELE